MPDGTIGHRLQCVYYDARSQARVTQYSKRYASFEYHREIGIYLGLRKGGNMITKPENFSKCFHLVLDGTMPPGTC